MIKEKTFPKLSSSKSLT